VGAFSTEYTAMQQAERLFQKGFTQIKPYLRTTPQPNL